MCDHDSAWCPFRVHFSIGLHSLKVNASKIPEKMMLMMRENGKESSEEHFRNVGDGLKDVNDRSQVGFRMDFSSSRTKTGRRVESLGMMYMCSGPGCLSLPRKSSRGNKVVRGRVQAFRQELNRSRQQLYFAAGFQKKQGGSQ